MLLPEVSNEDVDLLSFADVTSEPGLPAATRLDRLLVRATEAALDTTESSQYQRPERQHGASNANNRGAASQPRNSSTEKGCSHRGSDGGKQQPQPQQQQKKKTQRTMTLTRRMRSLFGLTRGGSISSSSEEAKPKEANRSNRASKPARHGRGSSAKNAPAAAAASLVNASNVEAPGEQPATAEAGAASTAANAETPEAAEAVEAEKAEATQADGQAQQPQPSPAPTPQKKPGDTTSPAAETPSTTAGGAPKRSHILLRGGPTTVAHKRVQEAIFRECRIVPIATMYKKVAMVPGRERLFFSAASNPRTMGSRMLYDIGYENFRHHTDCNRDFTRVGLKKICSNYCRPSQFRYVY